MLDFWGVPEVDDNGILRYFNRGSLKVYVIKMLTSERMLASLLGLRQMFLLLRHQRRPGHIKAHGGAGKEKMKGSPRAIFGREHVCLPPQSSPTPSYTKKTWMGSKKKCRQLEPRFASRPMFGLCSVI